MQIWILQKNFSWNLCDFRLFHGPEKLQNGRNMLTDTVQKQPTEVFYKKSVLNNFAKFRGKHLCQSLLFKRTPFLQYTSGRLLLTMIVFNRTLTISCMMMKNGQKYFKNLAVSKFLKYN